MSERRWLPFLTFALALLLLLCLVTSCGGDDDDDDEGGDPPGPLPVDAGYSYEGTSHWATVADPLTGRSFRCLTVYFRGGEAGGLGVWCYENGEDR